jgi:hypothetical protein
MLMMFPEVLIHEWHDPLKREKNKRVKKKYNFEIQYQLTSNGFNLAIWYRCSASWNLAALASNSGEVGGKHFQKCFNNSHNDKYKFLSSFSMSGGTNSVKEKKKMVKMWKSGFEPIEKIKK